MHFFSIYTPFACPFIPFVFKLFSSLSLLFSSFKFHPFLPNILVKKYLIHLRQVFFFHLSSPLVETSFLFPFSFWLLECSLELLLLRR